MPGSQFERFRAMYLHTNEAFRRGDYASAFAGLPEDFEWHPFELALASRPRRGPREVLEFFDELTSVFPDWEAAPVEFLDAGERTVVVRCVGRGTAAASGVPLERTFTQVWELHEDGRPRRVREFADDDEALLAAGLSSEAPSARP